MFFLLDQIIRSCITGKIISFHYDDSIDQSGGEEYFFVRNQQGDIIKIIDSNKDIIVEYRYDAWGNIISIEDISLNDLVSSINSYTYRGYRYDSEIQMYYLNSRFYNPFIGRFISSDGLLGEQGNVLGHNMYAYCQNNPVMYSDISGYAPEWANKMLIGAGIVAAIAVIAVITVATAGTGTLAAAIALGALKGAAVGYVSGAAIGAGVGYLSSGTSKGVLNGMGDGALIGAITGALIGGAVGGLSYSGPTNSMIGRDFGKLGKFVENPNIKVNWSNVSDYAMRRMATRGVSKGLVNSTVTNGVTLFQTSGRYIFITQRAAVVTTTSGTLVTTYSSAFYDSNMQEVIRILFGG